MVKSKKSYIKGPREYLKRKKETILLHLGVKSTFTVRNKTYFNLQPMKLQFVPTTGHGTDRQCQRLPRKGQTSGQRVARTCHAISHERRSQDWPASATSRTGRPGRTRPFPFHTTLCDLDLWSVAWRRGCAAASFRSSSANARARWWLVGRAEGGRKQQRPGQAGQASSSSFTRNRVSSPPGSNGLTT